MWRNWDYRVLIKGVPWQVVAILVLPTVRPGWGECRTQRNEKTRGRVQECEWHFSWPTDHRRCRSVSSYRKDALKWGEGGQISVMSWLLERACELREEVVSLHSPPTGQAKRSRTLFNSHLKSGLKVYLAYICSKYSSLCREYWPFKKRL